MSREAFLQIAEASGLDVNDPHMDELYAFLETIFPVLARINELDLSREAPAMVYFPPRE